MGFIIFKAGLPKITLYEDGQSTMTKVTSWYWTKEGLPHPRLRFIVPKACIVEPEKPTSGIRLEVRVESKIFICWKV